MGDSTGLRDVELYFRQIEDLIKTYKRLVAKIVAIKGDKRKAEEILELCSERMQLHESWIAKKQACRANIKMLPSAAAVLRERDLKGYQEEFREVDAEFKALGVMQDRANLLEGAHAARRDDPSRKTNTELLEGALSRQQETTNKLREALGTVAATQETARFTAATLEEDREKLKRIDKGLDEVDSELEISRKLITRFVKRLYTDKVIIAFAALLVLGVVGIIVYSTLNPGQKIFNVPDVVQPPTSLISATPSPSASLTRRLLRRAAAGGETLLLGDAGPD